MSDRYSFLLDENTNLKKALTSTKAALERTSDDYRTLKLIHDELKTHTQTLEKENREIFLKIEVISQEKKEIEIQFDTTIRNLKNSIEQKQKEIEEIQTKVMPILDQDMIKIKLINELEVPHKLQMEAKNIEVEKLQDENYELKRQIEMSLAKNDALKQEKEKENKTLQNKNKLELQELISQMEDLTERLDDNKDKEIIRSLKRENEELKLRLNHKDIEMDDIHNELTRAKEEKQQLFIKLSSKLDQEKDERLQAIASRDKLQKRVFLLDEDIKKNQEKLAQKTLISERFEKELMENKLQITNKDEIIKGLYKKIDERFEENVEMSQKHKDEIVKLTYENENLKRTLENEKNKVVDKLQFEIESLNEGKIRVMKEIENNKSVIQEMHEEIRVLKGHKDELIKRLEEVEMMNKENESEKMKVQSSLKSLKKRMKADEQPEKEYENKATKDNLPINNAQNNEKLNQFKEENSKLKSRIRKYGEKLAQANKKIIDLMKEKAGFINKLRMEEERPWKNPIELSTMKEMPKNYRGNSRFDEKMTMNKGFDENKMSFKSPLNGFGYDAARINYKDDVLIDEINRNINKGMEFYNL